jgi:hypothetical protein
MLSHIDIDPSQVHGKAAATTVTSVISATIAHFGVSEVVQTVAGIVAILSGCMAIAYYYVSILEKIRNRRS